MSDVLNPVEVETAIRDLSGRISRGVRVVSDRYSEYLAAERAYDQAFARAYMSAEGAAHERKYAAELATVTEREQRDQADVLYRYADRTAKALENELRAMQSIGASVRAMYATPQGAGR
ncbi:MAG TPA: hypothetical protein VNT51_06660 [Miltoncostaeaceae bacterium]|nr:hypothetical protein [Miltoncostaeaceae bacterium]